MEKIILETLNAIAGAIKNAFKISTIRVLRLKLLKDSGVSELFCFWKLFTSRFILTVLIVKMKAKTKSITEQIPQNIAQSASAPRDSTPLDGSTTKAYKSAHAIKLTTKTITSILRNLDTL